MKSFGKSPVCCLIIVMTIGSAPLVAAPENLKPRPATFISRSFKTGGILCITAEKAPSEIPRKLEVPFLVQDLKECAKGERGRPFKCGKKKEGILWSTDWERIKTTGCNNSDCRLEKCKELYKQRMAIQHSNYLKNVKKARIYISSLSQPPFGNYSRWSYFWRSTFLIGAGQYLEGRRCNAIVYWSVVVLAGVANLNYYIKFKRAKKDFGNAVPVVAQMVEQDPNKFNIINLIEKRDNLANLARRHRHSTNLIIYLWLANMIDALAFSNPGSVSSGSNIASGEESPKLRIGYTWHF